MSKYLKVVVACVALAFSGVTFAQGKIAVVNLQQAVLQTDLAQKRIKAAQSQSDYKSDKKEFEKLKKEMEAMVKKFQKDSSVMSAEQQNTMRQKLASKQSDLEYVAKKLQQAEAIAAQSVSQEMMPKLQKVMKEIIQKEGIGLLLRQEAVMQADAGYDITAKVTDRLNKAK